MSHNEVNKVEHIKRFLIEVMIKGSVDYDYITTDVYAIDLYMEGLLTYTDKYCISDKGRAWLDEQRS